MLNINSIYLSVMGECNSWGQGAWAVIVRTQGCSADCSYCDTPYAQDHTQENRMDNSDIIREIEYRGFECRNVLITGGEPLEQNNECLGILMHNLVRRGYKICLETNGLYPFKHIMENVPSIAFHIIADFKLPSSRVSDRVPFSEEETVRYEFYRNLPLFDFVKFVVADRNDFDVAIKTISILRKTYNCKAQMYMSPAVPFMEPTRLFGIMKMGGCPELDIGYNLQIHKYLFEGEELKNA